MWRMRMHMERMAELFALGSKQCTSQRKINDPHAIPESIDLQVISLSPLSWAGCFRAGGTHGTILKTLHTEVCARVNFYDPPVSAS